MGDPVSLVLELGREAADIINRGLNHGSTAESFNNTVDLVGPKLERIEQLLSTTTSESSAQDIKALQVIRRKIQKARNKYSIIGFWNCWMAPSYQQKLQSAHHEIQGLINTWSMLVTAEAVIEGRAHRPGNSTVPGNDNIRQPRFKIDHETMSSEFTVGWNSPLMTNLKSSLMRDGGDRILNLTGFTGSGKTTLAQQLCRDIDVRGSKIESDGDLAKQVEHELRENGRKTVLLVLDDVEAGSEQPVTRWSNQMSSNTKSKILVTSRAALQGLGIPVQMTPLRDEDAIDLLRHFVRPSGTSTYTFPDRPILLQVVQVCGGYPMAIKIIGGDLQGKPIEFWQKKLKQWSHQGRSVLQTDTELLTRLHDSLSVSKEYQSNREFFMDLGLFPRNKMIPVTALFDMWMELYEQVKDDIDAMIHIHYLTNMNLADQVVRRRIGSDEDNYYENHFITQHNIPRELAKNSSEQGEAFQRKRLFIEINLNDPPEWWQQKPPQRGISACLPLLKGPTQQRVDARILSILTDQEVTPYWCVIQAARAEVLILNLKTSEYTLPGFIREMRSLKVLIMINCVYRWFTKFKNFELIRFLQTLRRIRLQQVSVPCLWESKNLHKLTLYMCEVSAAFENSSMKFSNLVELNIEYCKDLVKLPDGFCDIETLEKLSISNCSKFTQIPQEIGRLKNLRLLRISYCVEMEEIPESITELKSLSFLDISFCLNIKKLPDNIGELRSLTNFNMSDCSISDLPADSVMRLTHLKRVTCDEYTYHLWEVIKGFIDFELKVETDKSVTLNWLRGDFEGDDEDGITMKMDRDDYS
ncbi:probable disease resistance protein At5g66910 isoform X2 [Prosopis cineraria]|uniref:probable disease resistance protein At5g66910 isoform X2 n=1 Tax=Prosopis cineraria TaxID=364024 RepID=UPI00240F1183|nr:probable disease resistance protein At5g66910 isoform X2 [Prosopis cineraria]XP_054790722.1 probable disease resistance protein At5g66910 isoform X2 [Prosopis cineraria]